ncbi:MAG: hypothetical protein H5U06_00270 [Candidatus Aminicenantes bacterium]|nr:hypothetical protein [Candidatus Aminicenantes bacterium]
MNLKSLFLFYLLILVVPGIIYPQQTSNNQQAGAEYSASVMVRVLKQHNFISNLTVDDFEVLEDGLPRKIEAIYLVDKLNLTRIFEEKRYPISLNKNYFILVQASDYDKKLGEAIDHLINNYFLPGDTLTLITPIKIYRFHPETLSGRPKNYISQELQNIMRSDIIQGNREYNNVLKDLKKITRAMVKYGGESAGIDPDVETESDITTEDFTIEYLLPRYKETLEKLDSLRLVDQNRFLLFSRSLKKSPGNNVVIFFYQREFRPEISPRILNQMMSMYQDYPHIINMLMELFQFYRREAKVDKEIISRALADSGAIFNFIYLNKKPERITGVVMNEQSEDIYEALNEAAQYTGGVSDNTSNAIEGLKKSVENASAYYLIYYQTERPSASSGFREIQVQIKNNPGYQVKHKRGYFPTEFRQ